MVLNEAKIDNYGVPNTVFSDMNEILMASSVMGGTSLKDVASTVGTDAAAQVNSRAKQIKDAVKVAGGTTKDADARIEIEVQNGAASARSALAWAAENGYGQPQQVFWTARPGALAAALKAAGIKTPPTPGHPADIAIVFGKNKVLGVSAKATKGSGDIGFKNPGWGTFSSILGIKITPSTLIEKELQKIDPSLVSMPANARKQAIRADESIKGAADAAGQVVLKKLRDELLKSLVSLSEDDLREFVVAQLVDAPEGIVPPYIKVTATGGGKGAHVHDPMDNPMLTAINSPGLKAVAVRNDSIIFSSKTMPGILQLRLKFESQALASSLKMSAEPAAKGSR